MSCRSPRSVLVPVSPGEFLDKISILQLKSERINDAVKLENVRRELAQLLEVRAEAIDAFDELDRLTDQLKRVNERLWCIEDDIRQCERRKDFGPRFIALARAVYQNNDERGRIKRLINELLDAELIEEKQYCNYA